MSERANCFDCANVADEAPHRTFSRCRLTKQYISYERGRFGDCGEDAKNFAPPRAASDEEGRG